jgi:hypothetical protein
LLEARILQKTKTNTAKLLGFSENTGHWAPGITYLLTYLLTPWSRVLLEKLTGLQLLKKFPEFYGTRKFITAFTSAHHLSLS